MIIRLRYLFVFCFRSVVSQNNFVSSFYRSINLLNYKSFQNSLASVFIKNDIAILGFGTYFVNLNRTQSSIDHHEKIKNWKILSLFSLIECCFGSTDHCQIDKTSFLNIESSLIIQNIMSINFKFETFFWQSVKNQRHKKKEGYLILQ